MRNIAVVDAPSDHDPDPDATAGALLTDTGGHRLRANPARSDPVQADAGRLPWRS
ncbi:hypothetical protein ABZ690_04170 [Streptomyces sp. NPDC006967]|uniref:hypothetical protein n=1 Tax=unclassified Streptomyces TaxID=2593676 RepID=UPI001CA5594D|nr:hypothetical protein [Streptomyces sp. SM1]